MGEPTDFGASLSDDLQYLFNLYSDQLSMSTADLKWADQVYIPMIVQFAKTG